MKGFYLLSVMLLALITLPAHSQNSGNNTGSRKVLVAYFSATGNTQRVAERIAELTGADTYSIEAAEPYAENPYDDTERIQNEAYNNLRPGVGNLPESLDEYDVIFVGTPVWWHFPAMVACTFLENYDLSGKTIVPFFTYGSASWLDACEAKIQEVTPDSEHLPVYRDNNANGVESWLGEIGMLDEPTANEPITEISHSLYLSNQGNNVKVTMNPPTVARLDVFSITGGLVLQTDLQGSKELALNRGVYIFRASDLQTNREIIRKHIIN